MKEIEHPVIGRTNVNTLYRVKIDQAAMTAAKNILRNNLGEAIKAMDPTSDVDISQICWGNYHKYVTPTDRNGDISGKKYNEFKCIICPGSFLSELFHPVYLGKDDKEKEIYMISSMR
ncbi:MAG: hypothetical protein QF436_01715 [Candidatus Woesearchaeota archaeon]|jgi:hypothetical protein|nr:hypothetical protein [Candidatus Woesearchaeota archaeon]MDP7622809.1 hypothetical protein [Candidatus Woesearchaeota archaeon]HJN56932.1 hypothetical protein [Candidatus Woesearchaeota archaeon]|tara:strand:+ start:67 stop:420 length:354 start_codon:yes stop_codon:yes gene_type:complete